MSAKSFVGSVVITKDIHDPENKAMSKNIVMGVHSDKVHAWSTRVDRETHLFLLDVKAEFNLATNAAAMRKVLEIGIDAIGKGIYGPGQDDKLRVQAAAEARAVLGQISAREQAEAQIERLISVAAQINSEQLRLRLQSAALKLSRTYSLPWPPENLSITAVDSRAAAVLETAKRLVTKDGECNLATLNPLVRYNASELKSVLGKLQDAGFVTLRTEKRSGPPTIWIEIPTAPDGLFVPIMDEKELDEFNADRRRSFGKGEEIQTPEEIQQLPLPEGDDVTELIAAVFGIQNGE